MSDRKKFYSVQEFAKKIGRHPDTVRGLLRQKLVKGNKLREHGVWLIPVSELERVKNTTNQDLEITQNIVQSPITVGIVRSTFTCLHRGDNRLNVEVELSITLPRVPTNITSIALCVKKYSIKPQNLTLPIVQKNRIDSYLATYELDYVFYYFSGRLNSKNKYHIRVHASGKDWNSSKFQLNYPKITNE